MCGRDKPYPMPSEFQRALSLRFQRVEEAYNEGLIKEFISKDFRNCMEIKYEDLDKVVGKGVEGAFYFDENSPQDQLTIYVDNSYRIKDDLLTSILLQHEIQHVSQFVNYKKTGKRLPCYRSEIEAFKSQIHFLTWLNPEEKNSLIARLVGFYDGLYSDDKRTYATMSLIDKLSSINGDSFNYCESRYGKGSNNLSVCLFNRVELGVQNLVVNNSYYQKQCANDIESILLTPTPF